MSTVRPLAATSEEWDAWEAAYERDHPVHRFFHDTIPSEFRYWKRCLSDLKYWFVHRTYDKYHVVRVHGMKPGYADKDFIMLHVNFGLLVDFVECEAAWMHHISKHECDPPFRWKNLMFWKHFSSPEDGIAYLDWAESLIYDESYGVEPTDENYGKPTSQAEAAREVKEIYLWYKSRDNRPDEHEASGWYAICRRKDAGEKVPKEETRAALNACEALEDTYEQEDESMLIRLMKVRRFLWT